MNKKTYDMIMATVAALIIILIIGLIYWQWSDCVECGGTFVRGVVWFKCLHF